WLAWGTQPDRSDPEYMPTRLEAIERIKAILAEHPDARALVGLDFAIGYPTADTGEPVLPIGRDLCALIDDLVTDDASGNNNRFHAACELNRRIKQTTGAPHGPFWGRPRTLPIDDLTEKRPEHTRTNKLRAAEIAARKQTNSKPKSAWQLAGAGSVGGQSLVGLKAVHHLLRDLGPRTHLWPFDPAPIAPNAVTIAEIYPSLFDEKSPAHWYKDARQVVDTRDAILDHPNHNTLLDVPEIAKTEGWILGVGM
ncbi:MAG: hypothetical protein AAFY46_03580, partial [Planctomycetota bacterium]